MAITLTWPDPAPAGTVGEAYTYTLTASGGTAPYTYSIVSGALPLNLKLNNGTISGIPTATGTILNPTHAIWTAPTLNADGSAIAAGEITGYSLGIRLSSGTAGTYPTTVAVTGAGTLTVALPALVTGSYLAAIQSVGPNNSAWSPEIAFTVSEVPAAPSALAVA